MGAVGIAVASGAEEPRKVSISPTNDLSAVKHAGRPGFGYGSAICGAEISEAFQAGHAIGSRNDQLDKRDFLVIDDGKPRFPARHPETGLPVVVLTDAKVMPELLDMVSGYNAAMVAGWKRRNAGPTD